MNLQRADVDTSAATVVEVSNLAVRYRNGAVGVTDVSIRVRAGELVALIGPNGAGKSTTVRALTGFMKTEGARIVGGDVLVHGSTVARWEPHRIARQGVACVPERRKIFANLTVRENLLARAGQTRRGDRRALLDTTLDLFPMLKGRMSNFAGSLSGGQRQMLAIGSAMMASPSVLVIDELTLGLHHSLYEPMYDAVRAITTTGTGVLIVDEHLETAAAIADAVHHIRDGIALDPAYERVQEA